MLVCVLVSAEMIANYRTMSLVQMNVYIFYFFLFYFGGGRMKEYFILFLYVCLHCFNNSCKDVKKLLLSVHQFIAAAFMLVGCYEIPGASRMNYC